MHIAIEGCAHGELETIYKCITELEADNNIKIDLLICCGDFQSVRNENDLRCMAVPPKYYNMCSFYKYYSGQLVAPVLTIFIGGNHEASNYLQELPFGGWVAPNIYYLGYAGVVNYNGLRIGGISGIYKGRDYQKGHFECSPYGEGTKRSVYHIRNVEVFRLKQLTDELDVFLSHDWPTEITKYGNEDQLLRFKPFFKDDIDRGNLGSPPCNELLHKLKPKYWFAAHLHCKFAALVPHEDGSATKFLALDKCVPKKRFLQVIDIPNKKDMADCNNSLEYDLEWLAILRSTENLTSTRNVTQFLPSDVKSPGEDEKNQILSCFNNNLSIPCNFKATAPVYKPGTPAKGNIYQPNLEVNSQTTEFCNKLGILDPTEELIRKNIDSSSQNMSSFQRNDDSVNDASQTFIEDDSEVSQSESMNESGLLSSGFKRKSLVLPDVVNKSSDDIEQAADEQLVAEMNVNQEMCAIVDDSAKESEENLDKSVEEKATLLNANDDKPAVKKFKRRNASIYEQEDT
ncbi:uncharacterized protein ldbr [Atheta coriaria]|uniref:uncharacterized protein ldbr n=1 Tax=Dalotia coriaria TaxID=877792 RepID=UPI0031F35BCD